MKTSLGLLTALIALFLATTSTFAATPKPTDNLRHALTIAARDHKMTFLLMGRSTCEICNGTRAMIREGKIAVSDANYVMADLNVDDARVSDEFMLKFKGQNFGEILPYVAVTDSSGKVLAISGGFKSADQWNSLLRAARAKAAATNHPAADSFSVFKTTPAPH